MMSTIYLVDFPTFADRFTFMSKKNPDMVVKYYEALDRYILYWTDEDASILCCEKKLQSFRNREEEMDFKDIFLKRGIPLLQPLSALSADDDLDEESPEVDFLEPEES